MDQYVAKENLTDRDPTDTLPDILDSRGLQKLLAEFTSPMRNNEIIEQKSRATNIDKDKERLAKNALLNDFRPKKTTKKEYYNKWYVPVKHWSVEKISEAPVRKRDLMVKGNIFIILCE